MFGEAAHGFCRCSEDTALAHRGELQTARNEERKEKGQDPPSAPLEEFCRSCWQNEPPPAPQRWGCPWAPSGSRTRREGHLCWEDRLGQLGPQPAGDRALGWPDSELVHLKGLQESLEGLGTGMEEQDTRNVFTWTEIFKSVLLV